MHAFMLVPDEQRGYVVLARKNDGMRIALFESCSACATSNPEETLVVKEGVEFLECASFGYFGMFFGMGNFGRICFSLRGPDDQVFGLSQRLYCRRCSAVVPSSAVIPTGILVE